MEGIRIIDVCVVWAGPFATMLLGDLGAEVIRVESLQHFPTATRGNLPRPHPSQMDGLYGARFPDREAGERPWNREATFNGAGRNKLSMTVDIGRPKGKEIFKKLVEISDVFVENNAYGVMERLGLGYPVLKEINPGLVMVSSPGYGNTGPYKKYMGFGANIEALVGHTGLRCYRDLPPSETSPVFHMDAAAGACIAFAVMAALYRRRRTGKGQFVDVAQAETIIPQMGQAIMDYTMNRRNQTTLGNRDPSIAPQGCYQCLGKDKWAVISVEDDRQWRELCRIIGRPELATAPRFADVLGRNKNHDELDRIIEQWTLRHTHYEVMHLLQEAGIPAGAVMEPGDCLSDPHLEQRGFYETITHPEAGTHPYPGFLWKMSKTPLKVRHPPPCLGEHNEYVYKQLLNVSDEEYDRLEREGHIGRDYVDAKQA